MELEFGADAIRRFRRSWDEQVPGGESLKQTFDRVVPYFEKHIMPELKSGKNILMAAHHNTMRALVKHLEGISNEDIPVYQIENGQIYIYEINEANGKIVHKDVKTPLPST